MIPIRRLKGRMIRGHYRTMKGCACEAWADGYSAGDADGYPVGRRQGMSEAADFLRSYAARVRNYGDHRMAGRVDELADAIEARALKPRGAR